MSPELKEYELDRVINTIKSFGWTVVSSAIEGDKVKVEFEKMLVGLTPDLKKFELDRIAGMVKNIGWSVTASRFADDKAMVSFEKLVKPVV